MAELGNYNPNMGLEAMVAAKQAEEEPQVEPMETPVEPTGETVTVAEGTETGTPEPDAGAESGGEEPTPTVDDTTAPSNEPTSSEGAEPELSVFEGWDTEDTDPEPEAKPFEPTLIMDIGKALELPDVKTAEELAAKVKEKIVEAQNTDAFVGAPASFKDALDVAKNGGDWASYLGIAERNYDAINDVDLVGEYVAPAFYDANGALTEEGENKLNDYLDNLSDVDLSIKAQEIRAQLKQNDEKAMLTLQEQAREKKAKETKALTEAINSLQDVSGFKVSSKNKSEMQNRIAGGQLLADLFHTNGQVDFDKIVQTYFKVQNFDKITAFLVNKTKNESKKEILDRMTNPNIDPTPDVTPEVEEAKEGLDAYMDFLQNRNK